MTGTATTPLSASYSTATAESVSNFLATQYALQSPIECTLLRRGSNDSFERWLRTDNATFCGCLVGDFEVRRTSPRKPIFWLIWMRLAFQLPSRCPRVMERCSRPHFCLKDGVRRCCSALLRDEGRKLTYPLTRGRKV